MNERVFLTCSLRPWAGAVPRRRCRRCPRHPRLPHHYCGRIPREIVCRSSVGEDEDGDEESEDDE